MRGSQKRFKAIQKVSKDLWLAAIGVGRKDFRSVAGHFKTFQMVSKRFEGGCIGSQISFMRLSERFRGVSRRFMTSKKVFKTFPTD